jgi:flagellar basal body-associated protein FliL
VVSQFVWKERLLGLAIISLLVLLVIAIIAIPIMARVLGEATRRNPNRPEGEGDETGGEDNRSGADRE